MDRSLQKQTRLLTLLLSLALHIIVLLLLLLTQELFKTDTQKQNRHADRQFMTQLLSQSRTPQAKVQFKDLPSPAPSAPAPAAEKSQNLQSAQAPTQQSPAQSAPRSTALATAPMTPKAMPLPARPHAVTTEFIDSTAADANTDTHEAMPYQQATKNLHTAHSADQSSVYPSAHNNGKAGSQGNGKISLAQITNGFLQSAQNERGATPKKDVIGQELALSRYYAKIWSALRQSFNLEKELLQLRHTTTTNTLLVMTIDKRGAVLQLTLQHPNKTPELRLIEESLRNAALHTGLLPPPPSALLGNEDHVAIRIPLHVDAKQGKHLYQLHSG